MRPPDLEIDALRTTAAITPLSHVSALRLSGPGVPDLLDFAVTSRLFVRENQVLHTLLLRADGAPFADAFVCQGEDSVLLLAEGPTTAALVAHLEQVRRDHVRGAEVTIGDLSAEHVLIGLDGPFAWELASALLGPDVLGAPYLSFLDVGGVTCVRAGKTGEYGYILLVPRDREGDIHTRLDGLAAAQGAAPGSLATLDQCALENGHFSMRLLDDAGAVLTPLELQLQWRVAYDKDFVGKEALAGRRSQTDLQRITCFVSASEVRARDVVTLDGDAIGTVLAAGWSKVRQEWVGWALLPRSLAHPGIQRFSVNGAAISTRSTPLLNNRSLYVDPHRHSHQTRGLDDFPPIVLP